MDAAAKELTHIETAGWRFEFGRHDVRIFDEEGDCVLWLPPFPPSKETCAAIYDAFRKGEERGEKSGRVMAQFEMRKALGFSA